MKSSLIELLNQLLSLQQILFQRNSDTAHLLTSGLPKEKEDSDEEIPSDTDEEDKDDDDDTKETETNILDLPSKRKRTLVRLKYFCIEKDLSF